MDKKQASQRIKEMAKQLGFHACGIARATDLEDHRKRVQGWLEKQYHGEMLYMQKNLEKRLDPCALVDNARSVIVVLHNYYPQISLPDGSPYLISRYAYGQDYHVVIKNKLRQLHHDINEQLGMTQGRVFTDSAPVLERAWATKAGLGWIGKNSMLITPRNGSYFFIGELIIDLELEYDTPVEGIYCGDCSRCIDTCPAKAINNDCTLDARRCISYLTIELKSSIPGEFRGNYRQWIFGCDLCQQVCPWNRFAQPHREPLFNLPESVLNLSKTDWETLSEERFMSLFGNSPLVLTKHEGIRRNILFLE